MKNKGLFKNIVTLAWPTMLEQLMQTAVQYIDLIMVGTLGTAATAAVGSTTTVNWLVNSAVSAIGVGFLAYIAKALGAREELKAKKASAQAVFVTLIVGVLFTIITLALSPFIPAWMQVDENVQEIAAQYFFLVYTPMLFRAATTVFGTVLRAAGDTKTPMQVGIIVNITNVVLNYIFIYETRTVKLFGQEITVFGMNMGVIGAAVASAVAFTLGGILITRALFRHPFISPKKQRFLPDKEILAPCLKVAFPNMLQRITTCLGYVFFAAMINSLGETSTAAHTVANTVESAFYIPGYGMQSAAATLAGNALGEKNGEKLKTLAKLLIIIETVLMIISGTLLFIFAPQMITLFSKDQSVIKLGAVVLRMVALSEPFFGITIVLEGMLQGMGKTVQPFVYNLIGMWGIRIVGTFVCTQIFTFGLESAWACMISHNLLLCTLYIIFWIKNRNKLMGKKQ